MLVGRYENEDGSKCLLPAVEVIRDKSTEEKQQNGDAADESNSLRVEADGPSDDGAEIELYEDLPQSPARYTKDGIVRSPSKGRTDNTAASQQKFVAAASSKDDVMLGQIADMLISRVLKSAMLQYGVEVC